MRTLRRVGILTSGGDCPGLNAAIRAFVKLALRKGVEVWGFRNGWEGVVEKNYRRLTARDVSGILPLGGTILGTSRYNPLRRKGDVERALSTLENLDALVVIGGNGSIHIAHAFQRMWGKVIFIPKTIDNDIWGTESIGFNTAVEVATHLIDRLHSTAESHRRVFVVQLMGRHTGWITLYAGMAAGADVMVIPEFPIGEEEIARYVLRRKRMGKSFSIVAVAEGVRYAHQREQNVGIYLQRYLARVLDIETRFVEIGYVLRGGTPTAYDRLMAHEMGHLAFVLAEEGRFGCVTAYNGYVERGVPIERMVGRLKTVPPEEYFAALPYFG
ncbi:MAG: 6-phosphofructokinase [Thermotogae bacterium]|nr:6-phosphofructokinase [Thermotogota bacterium]